MQRKGTGAGTSSATHKQATHRLKNRVAAAPHPSRPAVVTACMPADLSVLPLGDRAWRNHVPDLYLQAMRRLCEAVEEEEARLRASPAGDPIPVPPAGLGRVAVAMPGPHSQGRMEGGLSIGPRTASHG